MPELRDFVSRLLRSCSLGLLETGVEVGGGAPLRAAPRGASQYSPLTPSLVQPEIRFAGGAVRAVTAKAVVRQDWPDVAVVLKRLGGEG